MARLKVSSVPKRSVNNINEALALCRSGFGNAVLISFIMNVLMLTGPFYMLQIYDRVLASSSIPTLVAMSLLALLLLTGYGVLDYIRTRLMAGLGNVLDLRLADMAFECQTNAEFAQAKQGREALRDLGIVRQFLSGPAATGLMDVPWMPIYVGIVYLLHPVLGAMAIGASLVFIAIAATNEWRSKPLSRQADTLRQKEGTQIADVSTNIDSVRAMGMSSPLRDVWSGTHADLIDASQAAADRSATYSVLSKTLRLILQSAILGVGAYLVLQTQLSGGALIAASIIFARALAPIDQAVAQWRGILAARGSWQKLKQAAAVHVASPAPMPMRSPSQTLAVNAVAVAAPDRKSVILHPLSFALKAGDAMGLIGPSGAGKTSLLRALAGAITPQSGEIRLDGATPDQWSDAVRGSNIGYLAQDVQLLNGTIGQNIARFRADAEPKDIVAAAELAGVHGMIVALPLGYDTAVGNQGLALSAGQKQRVGLARAVFGQPFLVILDEPNAHLDALGEAALCNAMKRLKAAGKIVIVAAHRPRILAETETLLVLENGRIQDFGKREEVLNRLTARARPAQSERGLNVVGA